MRAALEIGSRFAGRYRVQGFLGRGGMGTVYATLDEELGERVALKVMIPAGNDHLLERFRREVRLARKVSSSHVARTHDIGAHDGVWYLTMELIDGESLRRHIERRGALPVEEVTRWGEQLCAGLGAAHAAGIVHRDLKPSNIMLDGTGRAVITDFGLARLLDDDDGLTHGVVGTPRYMAPEQLEGAPVDARADLYNLGLILFEMLTGTRFALGLLVEETRLGAAAGKELAARGTPAPLVDLIARLLQRDRDTRPASAAEVARVLAGRRDASTLVIPAVVPRKLGFLPFRGSGGDDAASLAAVLTEELVDLLSRTRGLTVLSSRATAALAERGDAVAAAGALGAHYLVDGTLWRRGEQLRVSVRLIATDTADQLYGERFEGVVADVFDLQDRVAQRIAEALRMELTLARRHGAAPAAAVQCYLRARSAMRIVEKSPAAVAELESALELAPQFEPFVVAHALASVRAWFTAPEPHDVGEQRARDSVARALSLAPDYAETHLAAGTLAAQSGAYAEAVRALAAALDIAPTCAQAHEYLGILECEAGRSERGMRRLELALMLDPTSVVGAITLSRELFLAGRAQEAAALIDDLESRTSSAFFGVRTMRLRLALWSGDAERLQSHRHWLGEPAGARSILFQQMLRIVLGEDHLDLPGLLAHVDAATNARSRAFALQLLAECFAATGQHHEALVCLERAAADALADMAWLDRCPPLAPLRADPRWSALRERVLKRAEAISV